MEIPFFGLIFLKMALKISKLKLNKSNVTQTEKKTLKSKKFKIQKKITF